MLWRRTSSDPRRRHSHRLLPLPSRVGAATRRKVALLLIPLAQLLGTGTVSLAQEARPGRVSATLPTLRRGQPGEVHVEADRLEQSQEETVLEGAVTLEFEESRVQADRLSFREKRYVEADGNVLMVWGANRISGTRMTYDLKEDVGVIENAVGQVEPEFYFSADRATTLGKDVVKLESATVTTCTQPVPYWSFSVSSAKVHIGGYAHLWNVRFKAGKVPIVYLPYLLWPAKQERAAGLLLTEVGTTRNRGRVLTQNLFIPLGRSADLTLFGEYYTIAGLGGGGEFRWIPNDKGAALLSGFFIHDEVYGGDRYRVTYRQTQEFLNGFRLVADVNQVSDFDFFTDYERELRLASSPTILGRIDFTRNGSWTSVNIRDLRREQLFLDGTSLVQRTLPELEWRGRSKRLGKTPLYVSFASSAAWIQQYGGPDRIFAEYYRTDFFPTLSAPISPVPWLDITPSVSYRGTWYSQHKEPDTTPLQVVDSSLTRSVGGATLEVVGPKLSKIYQRATDDSAPKYKHTIEPRLQYTFQQGASNSDEVIVYDETDAIILDQNLFSYGLRTRLLARRPRFEPAPNEEGSDKILFPESAGTTPSAASPADSTAAAPPPEPERKARTQEPVEILSFELLQRRAVDAVLNQFRPTATGELETSKYSVVVASGRYRPSDRTDLDLRITYDPLADKLSQFNLAGNLHNEFARANFSFVRQQGLGFTGDVAHCAAAGQPCSFFGDPKPSSTQMRLATGFTLFDGKLRLDTEGTFIFNPPAGQSRTPDRRWRMEYYTQCCGFLTEYLTRDFTTDNNRKEFRFTVDLRGIGKLLDYHE